MDVLIIGANGQVGTRLCRQLQQTEHTPVAMVRKEEQIQKFKEEGIQTVLADLEEDFSHAYEDIDAIVFTAGSGGDTSKSQTKVIDQEGAKQAVDEAKKADVNRFVMVSALKADRDPELWPDAMQHYYEAKSNADEYLRNSGLDYTILMPGRLTNEDGTGKVELKERIEDTEGRDVTRDDVAAVIVEVLDSENTTGKSLELLQGQTSIEDAVSNIS